MWCLLMLVLDVKQTMGGITRAGALVVNGRAGRVLAHR